MILFSMGSRVVPAASATLMSLIEVFLAPVWMWVFFGQGITANIAIGGAIVLAAVILNALSSGRAKTNLTLARQR
jgi:DME family drug/metabolite transporter